MHCKKLVSAAVAASALLMVAGCEKDVETHEQRMSVYPSLGRVLEAKVRIYAADGQELIGKGTTGKVGTIGTYGGMKSTPAVITVLGTAESTYFDESLGTFVSLPAGQTMHALVPIAKGDVAVTPLTEIAYRIAVEENLFPLTAREVNEVNERVRAALAPELDSIIQPPTILAALPPCLTEPETCLTDTHADRYALRLAVMARLGDGESYPILAVMQALGADVLDADGDDLGVIDGLDKNGDALGAPYDAGTLVGDINSLLADLAASYADAGLQAAVADDLQYPDISLNVDLANLDDGSNFSGCVDDFDSSLPDDFKGKTFDMVYQQAEVGSPYVQGEVERFTFCMNGQLRVTNEYQVVDSTFVTTPIDAIQTNYTWHKGANNLLYEAVAMSGILYEVNIFGENGAVYYGRFVK